MCFHHSTVTQIKCSSQDWTTAMVFCCVAPWKTLQKPTQFAHFKANCSFVGASLVDAITLCNRSLIETIPSLMIVIWNGLYFTMQYCRETNAGRNLTVLIVLISMIYRTIIVHLLKINPKLGGICYSSKPTATHVIWQSCLRSLRGLATCSKIWLLYLGERGDKGDCVTFFSALQPCK